MGKKSKRRQVCAPAVAPALSLLEKGDQVVLRGLENADFNGKTGHIVSVPGSQNPDRYGILVEGSQSPVGIRLSNIIPCFKMSDRVKLQGLKTDDYNGKVGHIISVERSNERCGVIVSGRDTPVSISTANLVLLDRPRSTRQQLEERRRSTNLVSGSGAAPDMLGSVRRMMDKFMTPEREIQVFGRKIDPMPDFYEELRNQGGGIPKGVDRKWAANYLRTSYEQSYRLPHFFEFHMKEPDYQPEPRHLIKRLGTMDRRKFEWYQSGRKPGDVYQHRSANSYHFSIRHSFSNQAYRQEALFLGTTHVAVGFVDLGMLFGATLNDPPSSRHLGPLHFIGVELSAYAVAKTLVIWEMLKKPLPSAGEDHQLRCVVQAWFSATWSDGTEAMVKEALASLLTAGESGFLHWDVKRLLEHWYEAKTLPVQHARKHFAEFRSASTSCIGDLERKIDRIAMAKYELTGDFGLTGDPVSGNTLMLDCPDGTAPLAEDETIFSALDWKEIVKLLSSDRSVIDGAELHALSNIRKLAGWASNGLVSVQLHCANVQDMEEKIVASKPWTMSWSNVLDYMDYREFHRLARACSVHGDTVHFGYSMNWPLYVYGVSLMDYAMPEATELRRMIIDQSNQVVEQSYKALGWADYLRLPPPVNPLNTTAHFGLEYQFFRNWVNYFFRHAQPEGPCNTGMVEHAIGSPLSPTGSSTVSMIWTYDPDVVFNSMRPY